MPKGERIEDEELSEILTQYHLQRKKGKTSKEACAHIGARLGRNWETVAHVIRRYAPTTSLAEAVIKKGSVSLARRIIQEADVDQSIDVLERVGVLAPKAGKGENAGSAPALMLSVSAESCGAVMIGVNQYGNQAPALPEGVAEGQHQLVGEDEEWIGAGLPPLNTRDAELLGLQGRDEEVAVEGEVLDPEEEFARGLVRAKLKHTKEELVAAGLAKIAAARAKV